MQLMLKNISDARFNTIIYVLSIVPAVLSSGTFQSVKLIDSQHDIVSATIFDAILNPDTFYVANATFNSRGISIRHPKQWQYRYPIDIMNIM